MKTGIYNLREEYISIDSLEDKEFYEIVKVGKISMLLKGGFFALDGKQRIVTVESNPERARSRAISLGCENPRVLDAEYLNKNFYGEHNKRLEKALSKN